MRPRRDMLCRRGSRWGSGSEGEVPGQRSMTVLCAFAPGRRRPSIRRVDQRCRARPDPSRRTRRRHRRRRRRTASARPAPVVHGEPAAPGVLHGSVSTPAAIVVVVETSSMVVNVICRPSRFRVVRCNRVPGSTGRHHCYRVAGTNSLVEMSPAWRSIRSSVCPGRVLIPCSTKGLGTVSGDVAGVGSASRRIARVPRGPADLGWLHVAGSALGFVGAGRRRRSRSGP